MTQVTSNIDSAEREYAQASAAAMRDEPQAPRLEALGHVLLGEFQQAELDRKDTEERWLRDLRQYRGQYDPEVLAAIGEERSKAFVRKTRVKVKTVDSRVADLLFPAGVEKNWEIGPTPKPSISPEQRQMVTQQLMQMARQAQAQAAAQQQGMPPQQMRVTPQMVEAAVLQMAKESAKQMAKTIDDQLTEARYKDVSVKAIHSGNLFGTGIVKGPLVERKVRTRFVMEGGKWVSKSESYVVPFLDFVPLWRFYPDMSVTQLDQCRYVYERHQMSKHELVALSKRRSFAEAKIVAHIKAHPDGEMNVRYYDNELRSIGERNTSMGNKGGQYEVLERWGYLDGHRLKEAGVDVPEERCHETFFSNVWLLPNGDIIRATLQPLNGVTWPYHLYYFDKDETSIFGEGLASIMRDDQTMLNAAVRMMLDNAAITAGAQLEVTTGLLSTTEKIDKIIPHRVWPRNGKDPGHPAIRVIELPNHLAPLAQMAAMFENNADEVTAIPRYMSGENATNGAAGTSSGLSMLMGAVNIVIKDLITAWDEGVTVSFIRSLYHWNMQFNPDNAIKGDYDVWARGTASLVAKEVRARQLNEFGALTANELDAPFIKRDVLNRQRAEALELSDVVKTEDEVLAEQNSPQAQQNVALQQQVVQLQVQEAQAKVAKMMAEAEATQMKAREMLANIELLVAKTVSTRVEAAFAALQAGGTATQSPFIAPAGDEILRSAGWTDATPDPSIAQLNSQPVQASDGTHQLLNKGQSFAEQPRAVDQPEVMQPDVNAPTGMVGRRAGIETAAIE